MVDYNGIPLLDTYVRPAYVPSILPAVVMDEPSTSYHVPGYQTPTTETTHHHLQAGCFSRLFDPLILTWLFFFLQAPDFPQVRDAVARAIRNNVIVGYRIWDFLSVGISFRLSQMQLIMFEGNGFIPPCD